MPLVDQFGNPIQLDTGVIPPVDPALTDTTYAPPPLEPPASAPDSTLTGGVFRPEPPPTTPAPTPEPAPPPTATQEPQSDPSLPPPSTNTSTPPG
jgi:hypothetical protein